MNKISWVAVVALATTSLIAHAQVPTRTANPALFIAQPAVPQPLKLTRPQLLNRLRTVPAGPTTTTPTTPAPTGPDPAPGIAERATLSIRQMYNGIGYLGLSKVSSQQSSSDPAPVIVMKDDSTWTVSFRGSANIFAIDCAINTPNISVAYEITQYLDGTNTRVSEGTAPLIDNHIVMTVPRGGEDKWVTVVFDPSIRPNASASFHSCQILELT